MFHRFFIAIMLLISFPNFVLSASLNDDGLHTKPWFVESFLELADDVATAAEKNKRVAIIIEQRGCIYCKKLHEEVLSLDQVRDAITRDYVMIQLNMFGDKEVLDLDGQTGPEKEMVRKWGTLFTPTIIFLPAMDELRDDRHLQAQAKAIMPGAFSKGMVLDMFQWVHDRGYNGEEPFQKYHARMIAERRAAK